MRNALDVVHGGVDDKFAAASSAGERAGRPAPGQGSLRVLIDAFNRDQSQGTGISTYSRVLYDAVASLGHRPSWLFGRASAGQGDAVAAEVTFHDPPTSSVGVVRQIEAAGRLWRGLTQAQSRAERISFNGVVVAGETQNTGEAAYNVPGLYRAALYRHELIGQFQNVMLPDAMDVFHMTSPLPVAVPGARLVTSICDLVPLRLPNTTPDNKSRMLSLLRACVGKSDLIVTVSEASKADIVNILGAPEDKVVVTYLATDMRRLSREETAHSPRVLSRFGLEPRKYLLFVSAIEPKKNLRRLIDAYLEIDTDLPLVIVGRKAWMWEQEIGHVDTQLGDAARRRLRFIGYAPPNDLRFLYAGARALAFPSLYEGFGLPALEAMKMGSPVMTSDIPALQEVCGPAAVYVDPYDVSAIRKGLERLIGDDRLCGDLIQAGLARAETFSYASFVENLAGAYRKLA